jgi:hypothetical protein
MHSLLWYLSQSIGILGTLAVIIGGGIAACKAIDELGRARLQRADELHQRKQALKQREREFRQKQAMFARDIIKDIFADNRASDALMMLDFDEYDYNDAEKNKTHHIKREELQRVLRIEPIPDSEEDAEKETFIRKCFERLYDQLEQLQNLLDVGVLNLADLESTFGYYMRKALKPDVEHTKFFKDFDYPGVERFMRKLGSPPVDAAKQP